MGGYSPKLRPYYSQTKNVGVSIIVRKIEYTTPHSKIVGTLTPRIPQNRGYSSCYILYFVALSAFVFHCLFVRVITRNKSSAVADRPRVLRVCL